MSVILHAPHFLPAEATALLYAHFGIAGKLSPLPSERDQNFYVYGDHGEQAVLKIANALETQELLEAQNLALACVAGQAAAAICPQPLPAGDGSTIVTVRADDGQRYMLRLLTYLDGKPLALVKPHSRSLLAALGRTAGQLMAALACFDHPALHRSLHWDVAQAAAVIPPLIDEIADPQRRALVSKLLERFAAAACPTCLRCAMPSFTATSTTTTCWCTASRSVGFWILATWSTALRLPRWPLLPPMPCSTSPTPWRSSP